MKLPLITATSAVQSKLCGGVKLLRHEAFEGISTSIYHILTNADFPHAQGSSYTAQDR
jgi:hypothetical protein